MQVDLMCHYSGERCWNTEVILAYADDVDTKEARLEGNADITINAGKIACQGSVVNEHGLGTMCTARLVETQFSVVGERAPLKDDAHVSMSTVRGFNMVKPGSREAAQDALKAVEVQPSSAEPTKASKRGLFRFLLP